MRARMPAMPSPVEGLAILATNLSWSWHRQARALFRRLMYPELKGEDGPETKASIAGHDKPPAVPLKVNAKYPESAPLPTVPPNLLARLPQLPEDVEYRIVGKDLILRDVDANIIVDFIPNAIR